jgi:hypothetical protein
MIIKKLKETLGQVFHSPEASGTWTNDDIECAIDDNVVDCSEMDEEPFVGIPAPAYLEDDEWFGPAPIRTEKQKEFILHQEATERLHEDMRKESGGVESEDIHQVMYDMATKNSATTLQLDPIGGSENFQGGSENVHR